MLAYKAEEEGIAAVEMMAGKPGTSTTTTIPPSSTSPRIGRRSATLRRTRWRRGTRCGSASSSPPTVARAMGEPDGQVKVIADAKTDRSSACASGAHAADLIHEAVAAMTFHGSAEDVARANHAHLPRRGGEGGRRRQAQAADPHLNLSQNSRIPAEIERRKVSYRNFLPPRGIEEYAMPASQCVPHISYPTYPPRPLPAVPFRTSQCAAWHIFVPPLHEVR